MANQVHTTPTPTPTSRQQPGVFSSRRHLAEALASLAVSVAVFLGGIYLAAHHTKIAINIAAWGSVAVLGSVLVMSLWRTSGDKSNTRSEMITERIMAVVIGCLMVALIVINIGR